MNNTPKRNRFAYLILALVCMASGLGIRYFGTGLPEFFKEYGPDTIWALMIFSIIAFILEKANTLTVFLAAMVFTFGMEASQLYQAEWINNIRNTTAGALLLGAVFSFYDLATYLVGCLIGVLFDLTLFKRKRRYIFKK